MYNSIEMTFDEELTTLSYKTSINAEFKIDEIQDEELWKVETINDNLIKAIPLFNCEQIISDNPDDIIIEENKCAILNKDEDTVVKCISNDRPDIHFDNMNIQTWVPYTGEAVPWTVYGILADDYMVPMVGAEIEVLIDGELDTVLITDNNGMVEYVFDHGSTIQFYYNMDRQYWII